jgi:3-phenylpropionate/trans-cinnamate dioxygenase ferredoxin component
MSTMAANMVEIGKINDIAEGTLKQVDVKGVEVMLSRVNNKYYAVQNRCPHMGGNLSRGTLAGQIVTCPVHKSQYDVTDGHVVRWTDWTGPLLAIGKVFKSPRPLKTYPVVIKDDKIFIQF